MSFDEKALFDLLPAIYRIRDVEQGEPLKALLTVLAGQVAVVEEDLAQLYDDQFIETCAEWVVPYIGDLIGDRPLHTIPEIISSRAVVANTTSYRRRKGTVTMLEQLARDVTGWPARAVEFFQLLATTQYMNHLRPANLATPDLRQWRPLEYLHTPFETTAHTADVRRIALQRGRYNIPNIGIFLWRLQAYRMLRSAARSVTDPASPADARYTFHPVGLDSPLFNFPQVETEITHLAQPINVPEPLRRRVLHEELEALRQALVNGEEPNQIYFDRTGANQEVFRIFQDDAEEPLPNEQILICDLSNWRVPPDQFVAVDPVLGRITFPSEVIPNRVEVSYTYGFSADVGGGSYDRNRSVFPLLTRPSQPEPWQRGVTRLASGNEPELVPTLTEAIQQWNSQPPGVVGIITIVDSQTYAEVFPEIQIPEESQLLIVAAKWEPVEVSGAPVPQRLPGQLSPEGVRPHLLGNLTVVGTAPEASASPGKLILNGLLVEGSLTVAAGNLAGVDLTHCTLVPPIPGTLTVLAPNPRLSLQVEHSICGPIAIAEGIPELKLHNSIVEGHEETAINAPTTATEIKNSTLLGDSLVQTIEASNSIFTGVVTAERRQVGCVRFSSLPRSSQVPRRYRCQPDLALAELAEAQEKASVAELSPADQTTVQLRVTPQFTSLNYGDPGYCQLSQRCAIEIRQGADDESEMGVFHDLFQPQRETNLRVRLEEYLRFSLEAGIFYMT